MKRVRLLIALILGVALTAAAQDGGDRSPAPSRFEAVDVFIDSGDKPLAAYQFELAAEVGDVKIVGIEGGEHRAFAEPPYYDPAALQKHRVIIAAFNTGKDLPTGKTRVARVHMAVYGDQKPMYVVKLHVAGSPEGLEIEAKASSEIAPAR